MATVGVDGVVARLVRAVCQLPLGSIGGGEAYCKFGVNRVVETSSDIEATCLILEGGGAD